MITDAMLFQKTLPKTSDCGSWIGPFLTLLLDSIRNRLILELKSMAELWTAPLQ